MSIVSIDSVSVIIFFMILLQIQWEIFFLPTSQHWQATFCLFLGICWCSCIIYRQNLSSETVTEREAILNPVPKQWISAEFRVTEANQNARKLLSTDLVNTTNKYNANRKYESERHFPNTTHIAIIWALEFSCKFDAEPFKQKRKTNTKRKFAEPQIDSKFFEFSVLRFSYYKGTWQSNPLTISYR